MEIRKNTTKLLIIEQGPSSVLLILGGFFLFFCFYEVYKSFIDAPIIGLLFGGFLVIVGLLLVNFGYENSTIEMNKETGKGIYVRKSLFSSEHVEFDLSEINSVYVLEPAPGSGGDEEGYSGIVISSKNRQFELVSHYDWISESTRQIVDKISDFLNIPKQVR